MKSWLYEGGGVNPFGQPYRSKSIIFLTSSLPENIRLFTIKQKTLQFKNKRYHEIPVLWPWVLLWECCPGNVADCPSGGQYYAWKQSFLVIFWITSTLECDCRANLLWKRGKATPWMSPLTWWDPLGVHFSKNTPLSYLNRPSYFACSIVSILKMTCDWAERAEPRHGF